MDLLDEPAVAQQLHYEDLIPAIANALAALSAGKVVQPVRTVLPVAPHGGFFAVMCDGSVQKIDYAIDLRIYSFLGNRKDGYSFGDEELF